MQKRFLAERYAAFLDDVANNATTSTLQNQFFTASDRRISPKTMQEFVRELQDLFARFRRKAQTDETLMHAGELIDVQWVACLAPSKGWFSSYLK